MSKILIGIICTLVLVAFGLLVGFIIGGMNTSTADGLAGGAIVFGYGVIGGAIALVIGVILSTKLEPRIMLMVGAAALVGCVGIVGYLRLKKVAKDKETARQEELEERDRFRSFRLGVSLFDPEIKPLNLTGTESMAIATRGKRLTIVNELEGEKCEVDLLPDESKLFLASLNSLIEDSNETACSIDDDNPKAAFFVWHFYDNESPKRGNVELSKACYQSSTPAQKIVTGIDDVVGKKCGPND